MRQTRTNTSPPAMRRATRMTPSTRTSPILMRLRARLQVFSRQNEIGPSWACQQRTLARLAPRRSLRLRLVRSDGSGAPGGDAMEQIADVVEIGIDHRDGQQREQ
jgi:hypothetical protein